MPELGDVETNPYPQHYVNVNALLKAGRSPEIGSLGFGSINGEVRFNDQTSKNGKVVLMMSSQPIFR